MPETTAAANEERFQRWQDKYRRAQIMPPDAEPSWIIRYCDQDVPDEVFAGHGAEQASRRRFDQQRSAWNISLFQEVARG